MKRELVPIRPGILRPSVSNGWGSSPTADRDDLTNEQIVRRVVAAGERNAVGGNSWVVVVELGTFSALPDNTMPDRSDEFRKTALECLRLATRSLGERDIDTLMMDAAFGRGSV